MGITIALAGNPNAGKTSIFNEITGAMQKVGNWGGVTVDIKEGTRTICGRKICFVDLPGTYSLSAFSEEERVARNYIVEEKPDLVVNVIDATNLERHLYLTVQLMEMGIQPVLALNMWDEVAKRGININVRQLERLLGLTVVPTNARTGEGVKELIDRALEQSDKKTIRSEKPNIHLPRELDNAITELSEIIPATDEKNYDSTWVALKLFEHDSEVEALQFTGPTGETLRAKRDLLEKNVIGIIGDEPENLITEFRYGYISGLLREVVTFTRRNAVEISDRIDSVLTHRFWAYPIFITFMWLLFQVTFKLGEYPKGWIENGVDWLVVILQSTLPASWFRDMLVDGMVSGVGGVIVFLPNILILFFGISIMEDTGYMARAAFIMDRLMHRIGLHGKSFIPMLMGLGCSVPAIMAARTLESRNDRIKTILLTPLVSCSARLPVFVLFAGALFPKHAGNVVFLFQVVFGFAAFIGMAFLFKLTLFRNSDDVPFVMELPPYRMPTGKSVMVHMWQKAQHYLKKMGGVVLLFSVILWWAGEHPKSPAIEMEFNDKIGAVEHSEFLPMPEKESQLNKLKTEKKSAVMRRTWIGRIGTAIEPVVKTFGSDWRGAVSLVTGFVAKEVVVSSMGVLYAVGEDAGAENKILRETLRKSFTPLSAFAFMLFVLLYTPCVVALVTVIRELKNWRWSLFSVVYQLTFAWTMATLVFQVGRFFGIN